MNWVKKTFFDKSPRGIESKPEPLSNSTSFHDYEARPEALDLRRADVRAAREMVYSCAKQTAALYGIPPNWLNFEVLTISDDAKAYFQLQVIMLEWDEHLFSRAFAFEQALMKRLSELNMVVARAVRAVLWRVSPEAGCPYDELPGPEAWTSEAVARREAQRLGLATFPTPVAVTPLSEEEKRALVRPEAMETVAPAFFATSAMEDLAGPVGSSKHVDTEVEYEASKREGRKPGSNQPLFEATHPTMLGPIDREA